MSDYKKPPMPDHVKKDILAYLNLIEGERSLSPETVQWVKRQPHLRINGIQKLYRGIFLKGDIAKKFYETYHTGDDFTYKAKNYTSWTSVLGVATRFSLNSEIPSWSGMKNWYLQHNKPEDFPISVIFKIETSGDNIVLSQNRLGVHYEVIGDCGREWEYILHPGDYPGKMYSIMTYDDVLKRTYLP